MTEENFTTTTLTVGKKRILDLLISESSSGRDFFEQNPNLKLQIEVGKL